MGCDFDYSAPVTSYQLLQYDYTLILDLLPQNEPHLGEKTPTT